MMPITVCVRCIPSKVTSQRNTCSALIGMSSVPSKFENVSFRFTETQPFSLSLFHVGFSFSLLTVFARFMAPDLEPTQLLAGFKDRKVDVGEMAGRRLLRRVGASLLLMKDDATQVDRDYLSSVLHSRIPWLPECHGIGSCLRSRGASAHREGSEGCLRAFV